MVRESAAAILARQRPVRARRPWLLLLGGGATTAVVCVAILFLFTPSHPSASLHASRAGASLAGSPLTEAAAARGASAAYQGYLAAFAAAGQRANSRDPRLETYLGGQALLQVRITLRSMAQSGLAYRGAFKSALKVTDVSLATQTVQLMDCQDLTSLQVIDARSGSPVAESGQSVRFPVVAQARYYEGRWMIVAASADRSAKC